MNSADEDTLPPTDQEWTRMWQGRMASEDDPERVARTIMAQVWRFDQTLFWRNAREYAAGIVLLVVFLGQLAMGDDRIGALVGIGSVGFVIGYLGGSTAAFSRSTLAPTRSPTKPPCWHASTDRFACCAASLTGTCCRCLCPRSGRPCTCGTGVPGLPPSRWLLSSCCLYSCGG